MKSNYCVYIKNDVICLIDNDRGAPITNNAKAIVQELKNAGYDVDNFPVIYRDTFKIWDWIHTNGGEFVAIKSLAFNGQATKDQDFAIAHVKKKIEEQL